MPKSTRPRRTRMTVPETDVNVDSSTTTVVETPETQPTQTEITNAPVQGEEQQKVNASDLSAISEDGRPIENIEAEWKRKHDQLAERLPEYIDQAVQEAAKTFQSVSQKQQEEPTYTTEQLRMVLHDDTGQYTASNKVWAEQELEKINEQKISKLLDDKFKISQQGAREQKLKADSEAYVIKNFPDMFKRDINGNVTGWNSDNPMTRLTAKYMKQLGDKPGAIKEAARQAFVDYQLQNNETVDNKVKLAQSEAAQLKSKQVGLNGGTVANNALQNQVSEAYKKFISTGNVRDAQAYNALKGRLAATQLKGK